RLHKGREQLSGRRRRPKTSRPEAWPRFFKLLVLFAVEDLLQLTGDFLFEHVQFLLLVVGHLQHIAHERRQNLAEARGTAKSRRGAKPARRPGRSPSTAWRRHTGTAEAKGALDRVQILPDYFLVRGHFEDRAVGAGTDQRVSIGQAVSTGDERSIKFI